MTRRLKKWMKNFAYKIVQSDGINIPKFSEVRFRRTRIFTNLI